jgi:hypothetical protein
MLGCFTLLISRNYKFVAILWDRNDLEQERRRGQSLGTVRCRKKNPLHHNTSKSTPGGDSGKRLGVPATTKMCVGMLVNYFRSPAVLE